MRYTIVVTSHLGQVITIGKFIDRAGADVRADRIGAHPMIRSAHVVPCLPSSATGTRVAKLFDNSRMAAAR